MTERLEVTAQGYRRFRWRMRGQQLSEWRDDMLNRTCLPGDVIA